jgi:hypothetical protein
MISNIFYTNPHSTTTKETSSFLLKKYNTLTAVPMNSSSLREVSIFLTILENKALLTNFSAYFSLEIERRFFKAESATL